MKTPPSKTAELAKQCWDDSVRWFGDTVPVGEAVGHHTLALAGEVGELANIVKKIQRGSLDPRAPRVRYDISMELADVYIYLLNLAHLLSVDLEKVYEVKRIENERRFSAERAARDAS